MVRARLPANPLFSVFGREPRAGDFGVGGPATGCFEAQFAPPSPLTLEVPFRGANSSHRFRAASPGPPGFFKVRFAPPSSRTHAAPSRGANSSHKFRAASPYPAIQSTHRPAPAHKKAPCRFIGKVLPSLQQSLQQFPRRSQSRGALLIN